MQSFRFLAFGALFVGLLANTACSGAAPSGISSAPRGAVPASQAADGTQQVTLTVGNTMSFEPVAILVRAGQPVTLTLRNDGRMVHDFTLSAGVAQAAKVTVEGGQTASGTFTLEKPGTYAFDCSMLGHALAGMRGTITTQ